MCNATVPEKARFREVLSWVEARMAEVMDAVEKAREEEMAQEVFSGLCFKRLLGCEASAPCLVGLVLGCVCGGRHLRLRFRECRIRLSQTPRVVLHGAEEGPDAVVAGESRHPRGGGEGGDVYRAAVLFGSRGGGA